MQSVGRDLGTEVHLCVCVRARAWACGRACVRACVRAGGRALARVRERGVSALGTVVSLLASTTRLKRPDRLGIVDHPTTCPATRGL